MPRVGDTGINIDVITNVDITTINGIRFDILQPDMTTTSWYSGAAVSSGNGRVRYTLSGSDIGMAGQYVISPFLDYSLTKRFHTPAVRLQVHPIFQP